MKKYLLPTALLIITVALLAFIPEQGRGWRPATDGPNVAPVQPSPTATEPPVDPQPVQATATRIAPTLPVEPTSTPGQTPPPPVVEAYPGPTVEAYP